MVSAFDFQDGKGRGNRIKRFGRKRKKAERILMDASIDNRTEYHRSAIRSICMIGKKKSSLEPQCHSEAQMKRKENAACLFAFLNFYFYFFAPCIMQLI